ncbi:tyrosinase-like [Ptychodera flava]|uniref:tyrosinase-like n=1 Tax=Ptychodera flava TaxID=63121 RepID=UPI00396A915A
MLSFVPIISFFVVGNYAFVPKVCTSIDNLTSKECCPVPPGSTEKCGGSGRGLCVDLRPPVVDNIEGFSGDVDRFNWPMTFFNRTCKCLGNFDGFICTFCKFGWTGPNCDVPKTRTRRNILTMTREEIDEFIGYFHQAKDTGSDYMIPTTLSSDTDKGKDQHFNEINVYDEFAWYHYYVSRENLVETEGNDTDDHQSFVFADFAHEGPSFPTWHRAYLLLFERALQKVSKDKDLTIPYWDSAGEPNCTVCNDEYLGGSNGTNNHTVTGSFSDWRVLCHGHEELTKSGQLCGNMINSYASPPITRNPGGDERWKQQNKRLPSKEAVYFALSVRNYDSVPDDFHHLNNSWKTSHCSFRNILEGFADSENKTGLYMDLVHQLHNGVHLYLNGTMSSLAVAASDPIFFLHHANTDRIFEKWLRRYDVSRDEFPGKSTPTGHNRYSYMVPFFPVYTNDEFFQRSEHFGYTYNDIDSQGLPLDPIEREREVTSVNGMEKCQMPTP